ncbi:DUF3280 domain-containing protein [Methylomicrobium album]|uniref:DUF2380 domain-containing protein n=1 Tax=Methylomicrobium album BG8 TaxID=686340 RepID=H8GJU7_METAL|nr:DUF3280 domain-containing protein [Methylomicrobium album]EIC27906.1 Protein of unknown function (DUF2380) [Methylomicrobium album BG8]
MYRSTIFVVLVFMLLAGYTAQAAERIAVLDFELNDLTSLPYTPEERRRTASFRPLLEQALKRTGDYEMVRVDAEDQAAADAGLGYLFRFPELAARLGEQAGADWVVVGRHSKPSFLYSYLIANLVDVKNRALAAGYAIELKGSHEKVSQRGIEALAKKIHDSIKK